MGSAASDEVRRKGDGLCCTKTRRGQWCRNRGVVPDQVPGSWFVYCRFHVRRGALR